MEKNIALSVVQVLCSIVASVLNLLPLRVFFQQCSEKAPLKFVIFLKLVSQGSVVVLCPLALPSRKKTELRYN